MNKLEINGKPVGKFLHYGTHTYTRTHICMHRRTSQNVVPQAPTYRMCVHTCTHTRTHTHTHTRLMALCLGQPRRASTRKVKPIWNLLKQETVSGSGISWLICKSAPCSRHRTTPALHHSVLYRPDALPATQPTVSKHWRHNLQDG